MGLYCIIIIISGDFLSGLYCICEKSSELELTRFLSLSSPTMSTGTPVISTGRAITPMPPPPSPPSLLLLLLPAAASLLLRNLADSEVVVVVCGLKLDTN